MKDSPAQCGTYGHPILTRPFKSFTPEEQLEIIKKGRFTDLRDVTIVTQNDRERRCRAFAPVWYQRVKWLTGNTVNKKFYCWSCLLFPSGSNRIWNSTGFDDLRNLTQATKKHEESRDHTYSSVKLKLMCKDRKVDEVAKRQHERNVLVKRNREYLERIIDISTTLALLEIPFRKDGDADGAYKGFLSVLKNYDDITRTQLEQTSLFTGLTKTIQIDLLQSIAHTMRQRIIEEMSMANFFSLIVNEVTCNPQIRQLSVAVRYVKNGKPVERFIGLYEIGYDKKSEAVIKLLDKELEPFNYKEKMISQSYDGGVVKSTELYNLQQSMKKKQNLGRAQFVHYYAHDPNLILIQSLHSIQECKLFFAIVSQLCKLFKTAEIKSAMVNEPPWWFDSTTSCIMNLASNRQAILSVLDFVVACEMFEDQLDTIAEVVNLINHLRSYKFVMFLIMFETIFLLIEKTFINIRVKPLNTVSYRDEINDLVRNLKQLKPEPEFKKLLDRVNTAFGSQVTLLNMFVLYVQVLDHIIYEIDGRFLDIELADFFALVSLPENQSKKFRSSFVGSIQEHYPTFFDIGKLKMELELFYSDPTIGGIGECDIKKPSDIMNFIFEKDIICCIPELYKLLRFVATVPTLAEPLEGDSCVLNRIKAYCNSRRTEEPRNALALLVIEKKLLLEMQKSSQWNSQIIDHFAALPSTSSIELTYKNEESMRESKYEFISEPEIAIKSEPDTI